MRKAERDAMPAQVAPTGQMWTHPIVSSAPNTAWLSLRGPPSVPVRAAIIEPPGRARKRRAHVSPGAGPGHL
uniref:EPH receptor A1 n=1 Tax=Myotis myotis TaxID=51298 RepID=A0A7J7V2W5_MYOMY|nr:EPH receptor A1 [Myotis myotis]